MNKEQARKIIIKMYKSKFHKYCNLNWGDGDDQILVDGKFNPEELRAIAWSAENGYKYIEDLLDGEDK